VGRERRKRGEMDRRGWKGADEAVKGVPQNCWRSVKRKSLGLPVVTENSKRVKRGQRKR